jgi:rhamnosyltransferase
MNVSVHAIVVIYKPDLQVLHEELRLLHTQVSRIWLMINADYDDIHNWSQSLAFKPELSCVDMMGNQGIGTALNRGFQLLRDEQAEYALILDQDSLIKPNMVDLLLIEARRLCSKNVPVALLAPRYSSGPDMPLSSFVRHGWLGNQYLNEEQVQKQSAVEIDFAISSGSLMPMTAISAIGPMDESLFIDHVDTEWCLRARSMGYKLFGVSAALMIHTLGDNRVRIWWLRWRSAPYHSSFRYYYILRNSIILQKRSYVSAKWRIGEFFRCLRVILFYTLFAKNRRTNLQMMLKGIEHGVKGLSGPIV